MLALVRISSPGVHLGERGAGGVRVADDAVNGQLGVGRGNRWRRLAVLGNGLPRRTEPAQVLLPAKISQRTEVGRAEAVEGELLVSDLEPDVGVGDRVEGFAWDRAESRPGHFARRLLTKRSWSSPVSVMLLFDDGAARSSAAAVGRVGSERQRILNGEDAVVDGGQTAVRVAGGGR